MTDDEKRIVEWLPFATAPKDGSHFMFCEAGRSPVYIGKYARPSFANVLEAECLCYLSYTDTTEKNLFRYGGMIKCGLRPTHWSQIPKPPTERTKL